MLGLKVGIEYAMRGVIRKSMSSCTHCISLYVYIIVPCVKLRCDNIPIKN